MGPPVTLHVFRELPRITDLRIQPKRGRVRNELTLFRYDVTLRLDGTGTEQPEPMRLRPLRK